jgi:hypothetical protein
MYIEIALDEADGTDVWSQQIIAVNEEKNGGHGMGEARCEGQHEV